MTSLMLIPERAKSRHRPSHKMQCPGIPAGVSRGLKALGAGAETSDVVFGTGQSWGVAGGRVWLKVCQFRCSMAGFRLGEIDDSGCFWQTSIMYSASMDVPHYWTADQVKRLLDALASHNRH